jgi:hypothetical protein
MYAVLVQHPMPGSAAVSTLKCRRGIVRPRGGARTERLLRVNVVSPGLGGRNAGGNGAQSERRRARSVVAQTDVSA